MINLDSVLESRYIALPTKVRIVKAMVFPVVTYSCETWTIKKAESQRIDTVVLEKTPERPLDSKRIKSVYLKGDQPWIFTGRTEAEAEAEAAVFWSSDTNSWLTGKVSDVGKDWAKEKRASEDGMAGWHHRCNGYEFGQTSADGEGQGGLACCRSPWDMTWRLNSNNNSWFTMLCSF